MSNDEKKDAAPKKRRPKAKPKPEAKAVATRKGATAEPAIEQCDKCGAPLGDTLEALTSVRMAAPIDVDLKVALLAARTTSSSVAVNIAVHDQLVEDDRWPPVNVTKVMGTDYNYGDSTMRNFLSDIADRLSNGNPSYTFTWDAAFVANALGWAVSRLIAEIDVATV